MQREQLGVLALQLGVGGLRACQLVLRVREQPPPLAGLALHGLDGLLPHHLLPLTLVVVALLPLQLDPLAAVHRVELGQQCLDGLLVDVHLQPSSKGE